MYRGYLTRKRMRLATLDMLKDSSLDSFEEELELEGDSKSKQDFQRLYAKLEGWRINADKKISSKKSGYGLMRARSNLVSEEALKLSELAANRDAYKAEEKHYLVRNIIFKVTFHNRKIMRYTLELLYLSYRIQQPILKLRLGSTLLCARDQSCL